MPEEVERFRWLLKTPWFCKDLRYATLVDIDCVHPFNWSTAVATWNHGSIHFCRRKWFRYHSTLHNLQLERNCMDRIGTPFVLFGCSCNELFDSVSHGSRNLPQGNKGQETVRFNVQRNFIRGIFWNFQIFHLFHHLDIMELRVAW